MAEKTNTKDRLKEITDRIESGIQELFQSDKYRQYLSVMSRFHKYSVNNTMLIYLQNPDATLVAGYNAWEQKFKRHVMKGEKGIKILAPTPYKKKIEREKLDPDTRLPLLDAEGNPIKEEKEVKIPYYKPVTVFDVSQTYGKPLPELVSPLTGDVKNYEAFWEAVCRTSPVPVQIKPLAENTDGFFSLTEQSITLREGMSEVQTICAAIHEIAHSLLHNTDAPIPENARKYQEVTLFDQPALFDNGRVGKDEIPDGLFRYELCGSDDDPGIPVCVEESVLVNHAGTILTLKPLTFPEEGRLLLTDESGLNFEGGNLTAQEFLRDNRKDRRTQEVEAESISYAVCQYYDISTEANSLGYIASWSKGRDLKELRASLETINKTANALITDINRHYKEVCQERGISQETQEPPQTEISLSLPDPAISIEAMNAYGYVSEDMLPLTKDRAEELFEQGCDVYMLYEGNGEGIAFEPEDIQMHTGIFGITRKDWEQVKNTVPARTQEDVQTEIEKRFLDSRSDSYAIYQLIRDETTKELSFMNTEWLDSHGFTVERKNYNAVYTGSLPKYGTTEEKLDQLFEQFNVNHPADFTGHSLSISDIVALKQGGEVSCHYVDSIGFPEISHFLPVENHLKAAEMSMEDDYGMIDGIINNGPKQPTVEELEVRAKSGQPISVMELAEAAKRERQEGRKTESEKKPSVLAKLRSYQNMTSAETPERRSAERNL